MVLERSQRHFFVSGRLIAFASLIVPGGMNFTLPPSVIDHRDDIRGDARDWFSTLVGFLLSIVTMKMTDAQRSFLVGVMQTMIEILKAKRMPRPTDFVAPDGTLLMQEGIIDKLSDLFSTVTAEDGSAVGTLSPEDRVHVIYDIMTKVETAMLYDGGRAVGPVGGPNISQGKVQTGGPTAVVPLRAWE